MPQINLKLDGVPIKIPNGFFPQETWKMYTEKQRAKDFFFKKPVKKIYMKKPTTKNRQDTKYLSYRHQAVIKHGIVTDTGKLTHETKFI